MLYFIANETARTGKGTGVWRQVQTELKEKGVEYKAFKTEHENHASELAAKISRLNDDDISIIVVGGDGTLNEVVNGITDFEKVRVSLIPAGSGNDFARGLGIKEAPKKRLEKIFAHIEAGKDSYDRIDLCEAEWEAGTKSRMYAISSGIGMDALVCKKMMTSKVKVFMNKVGLSKLSYLIVTVQSLFSMETSDMRVVFDNGDEYNFKNTIFGAAMNTKAEGGGVPMAPKASVQDGFLSTCFVHTYTKVQAMFRLPLLALGKHEKFKGCTLVDCKEVTMQTEYPMTLHTDGEYMGEVTEVTYRVHPAKMKFML